MYTFRDSLESMVKTDKIRNELNKAKYSEIKIKAQQETSLQLSDKDLIYANVTSSKDYLQDISSFNVQDCVIPLEGNITLIDINYALLLFKRSYDLLNNYDFIDSNIHVTKNDFHLSIHINLQKTKDFNNKHKAKVCIDVLSKYNNSEEVNNLISYETIDSDIMSNTREEASRIMIDNENVKVFSNGVIR